MEKHDVKRIYGKQVAWSDCSSTQFNNFYAVIFVQYILTQSVLCGKKGKNLHIKDLRINFNFVSKEKK